MANERSWQEMRVGVEDQLRRDTGADYAAWTARIRAQPGLASEPELRRWLEAQGIDGYPRMFLVYESFGYPAHLLASADELVDGQYRDRETLRPIYERLVAEVAAIGPVTLQTRKTYVSLVGPRRTFAAIQPTTKTRVDLGLRLDDVAAVGRLEASPGAPQAAMTHRLRLAAPDDVDTEVVGWLRRAYDANA